MGLDENTAVASVRDAVRTAQILDFVDLVADGDAAVARFNCRETVPGRVRLERLDAAFAR